MKAKSGGGENIAAMSESLTMLTSWNEFHEKRDRRTIQRLVRDPCRIRRHLSTRTKDPSLQTELECINEQGI